MPKHATPGEHIIQNCSSPYLDNAEKNIYFFYFIFKYNQQDATLYNIFITVNAWHVSGGFSTHHQELKNCTHIRYMSSLLAATASGSSKQAWLIPDDVCTIFELLMMGRETAWNMSSLLAATASGSSKQAWHIPDDACTIFELLMMGGETAWNMLSIDSHKEYCITLHLVGYT